MRNLAFTLAFAEKDVEASLCWHTESISIVDLRSCKTITLNNEKYKVFSYKLGFTKDKDLIEFNGVSEVIIDNFLDEFKDFIPEKLYLEDIVVVDEKNEKFKLEHLIITVTK